MTTPEEMLQAAAELELDGCTLAARYLRDKAATEQARLRLAAIDGQPWPDNPTEDKTDE